MLFFPSYSITPRDRRAGLRFAGCMRYELRPANPRSTTSCPRAACCGLSDTSGSESIRPKLTKYSVWATIARHERFSELTMEDFDNVKHELVKKIKCYGYVACLAYSLLLTTHLPPPTPYYLLLQSTIGAWCLVSGAWYLVNDY
jgi:hypothetical protein